MSTSIYLGRNTHIDTVNRVYPNYSSPKAAFDDITSLSSMSQVITYTSPLVWQQDNTVKFVVKMSEQSLRPTYACWQYVSVQNPSDAKKVYCFGIVTGVRLASYDLASGNCSAEITVRRDFMTEYLSTLNFTTSKLTRYTVPASADDWGAFPQDEPVSYKSVIKRMEYLFPFSDSYPAVMEGAATFYPVVTFVAFPENISNTQHKWDNPSPLGVSHNKSIGRYSTAAMSYVVCKQGLTASETNAWEGFAVLLDNIKYAGVQLDQYIANVSLVPADLIDVGSGKNLLGGIPAGALGLTVYECRSNGVTQSISLLDNTDANEKSQYYGGSVAVISGGKKYIEIPKAETDGNISVWSSFNGIPCMRARMGFIPGEYDPGDPFNNTENPSDGRAATIPFPNIPISSDTFQAWWRSNRLTEDSNYLNKITGLMGAAASLFPSLSNPAAIPGALTGLANTLSNNYLSQKSFASAISSAEASSVYVGSLVGSDLDSNGSLLSVVVYGLPKKRFKDVTNLFRRYGYSVGGMSTVPLKDNGTVWTYIEGAVSFDTRTSTEIPPEKGLLDIVEQFGAGVTLWLTNKLNVFGDFDRSNRPEYN